MVKWLTIPTFPIAYLAIFPVITDSYFSYFTDNRETYCSGSCCYEYILSNMRGSWHESYKTCKWFGGNLAQITNQEINTLLASASQEHIPVWVDGTDMRQEGDWRFQDGTPLAYTNWGSGQPNDLPSRQAETANCLMLYLNLGFWIDNICSYRYRFICQFEKCYAPRSTENNNGSSSTAINNSSSIQSTTVIYSNGKAITSSNASASTKTSSTGLVTISTSRALPSSRSHSVEQHPISSTMTSPSTILTVSTGKTTDAFEETTRGPSTISMSDRSQTLSTSNDMDSTSFSTPFDSFESTDYLNITDNDETEGIKKRIQEFLIELFDEHKVTSEVPSATYNQTLPESTSSYRSNEGIISSDHPSTVLASSWRSIMTMSLENTTGSHEDINWASNSLASHAHETDQAVFPPALSSSSVVSSPKYDLITSTTVYNLPATSKITNTSSQQNSDKNSSIPNISKKVLNIIDPHPQPLIGKGSELKEEAHDDASLSQNVSGSMPELTTTSTETNMAVTHADRTVVLTTVEDADYSSNNQDISSRNATYSTAKITPISGLSHPIDNDVKRNWNSRYSANLISNSTTEGNDKIHLTTSVDDITVHISKMSTNVDNDVEIKDMTTTSLSMREDHTQSTTMVTADDATRTSKSFSKTVTPITTPHTSTSSSSNIVTSTFSTLPSTATTLNPSTLSSSSAPSSASPSHASLRITIAPLITTTYTAYSSDTTASSTSIIFSTSTFHIIDDVSSSSASISTASTEKDVKSSTTPSSTISTSITKTTTMSTPTTVFATPTSAGSTALATDIASDTKLTVIHSSATSTVTTSTTTSFTPAATSQTTSHGPSMASDSRAESLAITKNASDNWNSSSSVGPVISTETLPTTNADSSSSHSPSTFASSAIYELMISSGNQSSVTNYIEKDKMSTISASDASTSRATVSSTESSKSSSQSGQDSTTTRASTWPRTTASSTELAPSAVSSLPAENSSHGAGSYIVPAEPPYNGMPTNVTALNLTEVASHLNETGSTTGKPNCGMMEMLNQLMKGVLPSVTVLFCSNIDIHMTNIFG